MRDQIEEASGLKIVSMVDATLDDVKRRGLKNVGVLAFISSAIYQIPLERLGYAQETIGQELQARLDTAILSLMEGNVGAESKAVAAEAVAVLRSAGCDGIILGCTEIPLLLGEEAAAPDLINPAQLLAEAAVREAIS
jgi:aspartate racemase